jgi:hypothetical protein
VTPYYKIYGQVLRMLPTALYIIIISKVIISAFHDSGHPEQLKTPRSSLHILRPKLDF